MGPPPPTRREFLGTSLRAALALPSAALVGGSSAGPVPRSLPITPDPRRGWHGFSSAAMQLRAGRGPLLQPPPLPSASLQDRIAPARRLAPRFSDLPRHFIFEYYPWYDVESYRHWDQWDRVPPDDMASNYVPRLGPYDSLSHAVLEQHARWILASGAGAVNLSWWGPGSWEDRAVNTVMDVMRDHGIKVTFHLEPYDDRHASRFAEDVLYLIREYGDRRRFDALLILKNEDGTEGPLFKGFRCILPPDYTDCKGANHPVGDYTPDGEWRRQTDGLRRDLRSDFHHVTILADSLEFSRTPASGFDGIAIYDPFVPPEDYAAYAAGASAAGLVFSFNVNAGYDGIEPRTGLGDCYEPTPFAPPTAGLDWTRPDDRDRAALRASQRITESFQATLRVQDNPVLANRQRGFFLVYFTSFNEWHEGTAFEPMQDAAALTPAQRLFGYHNPARGDYRLDTLAPLVHDTVIPPVDLAAARPA